VIGGGSVMEGFVAWYARGKVRNTAWAMGTLPVSILGCQGKGEKIA